MRRGIIVGAALALALSGCGSEPEEAAEPKEPASSSESQAQLYISGVLSLVDLDGTRAPKGSDAGDPCYGVNGYDDINAGAEVVVRNSAGETVGLGELEPGEVYPLNGGSCDFDFFVDGVTDPDDFFSVEVAGRGEISFTRDEASSIRVSLG